MFYNVILCNVGNIFVIFNNNAHTHKHTHKRALYLEDKLNGAYQLLVEADDVNI